jgi:hypothetical protein
MVAVGGFHPAQGNIMAFGELEHVLMHLRAQNLENQEIRTRSAYRTEARNYGDISLEMTAETTQNITPPGSPATYSMAAGTPIFIETMRSDSVRYSGLVSAAASTTSVTLDRSQTPLESLLHTGEEVEINGEQRRINNVVVAGNTITLTLANALSVVPPIGSVVLIRGRDFANPHMSAVHRVTDKYGSSIIDSNRYQVDRISGRIRYRPSAGTLADSVWHPENLLNKTYYFGREMSIQRIPPAAGVPDANGGDGIVGNEELGVRDDPVASGSNPLTPIAAPGTAVGQITNYGRNYPDGEFSNIRITAPQGVAFQVELNGATIAVFSNANAVGNTTVTIPFFDPDFNNDQLKGAQSVDPDIYIQRFLKQGDNNLVVKATATQAGNTGIRVEGIFNGVNLATGAAAFQVVGQNNPKPLSSASVIPTDWSASQFSVLGVVGKIDFELGDRIALEDVNDEVQKTQGVLEALTTLIAATDINQVRNLLSAIK